MEAYLIAVQAVIVNWNSGKQLAACLESLVRYPCPEGMQITVVDNASSDGSEKAVENYNAIELIRNQTNRGFSAACNIGSQNGTSEFVLFLNPDACVFSETLERVLAVMRNDKYRSVGICGVQLVDSAGQVARTCCQFPTARSLAFHALGVDRILPSVGFGMARWAHDRTCYVDHVIGAFYFVRRKLFQELSGFDERFFVYLEDLDFSRRAALLGWRSLYLAEAQAYHLGGGTSRNVKALRLFYSLQSRILYSFKHIGAIGSTILVVATLTLEPAIRSLNALGRMSVASLKETVEAYMLLLRWFLQWLLRGARR